MKNPLAINIEKDALENKDFRRVIWTGDHLQVVLMAIHPGEEIGIETHAHVDQFFRVESGNGMAIINGVEYPLAGGSALAVPAGSEHNIMNTGSKLLVLYTIYTPPNHIDARVHHSRADAVADTEDEAFGQKVS